MGIADSTGHIVLVLSGPLQHNSAYSPMQQTEKANGIKLNRFNKTDTNDNGAWNGTEERQSQDKDVTNRGDDNGQHYWISKES